LPDKHVQNANLVSQRPVPDWFINGDMAFMPSFSGPTGKPTAPLYAKTQYHTSERVKSILCLTEKHLNINYAHLALLLIQYEFGTMNKENPFTPRLQVGKRANTK